MKNQFKIAKLDNGLLLDCIWNGCVCDITLENISDKDITLYDIPLFSAKMMYSADTELYGEGFNMLSQYGGTIKDFKLLGSYSDYSHYKLKKPDDMNQVYNMLMLFPKEESALRDYIYNGPGTWYGGTGADRYDITKKCVIIFDKAAVGDSTSLTLGDSLNFRTTSLSTTLNNPEFPGAFSGFASDFRTLEDFRRADIRKLFPNTSRSDRHLECQLHGQSSHALTSINVKEVIFPVEPSKELQEKLKKANIPWRVL
jgi:hypothetical protein